ITAGNFVYLADAAGAPIRQPIDSGPSYSIAGVAWSPDSSELLVWKDGQEMSVLRPDTLKQIKFSDSVLSGNWMVKQVVWSPDGKTFLVVIIGDTFRGDIYSFDADGKSAARNLTHSDADDNNPAWSPDGSKIAFESDGHVRVMRNDGSEQQRLTATL